jgi:hypothetical protein
MTYDSALVRKAMFRPKNQQIELHLGLNTNNPNYDRSKVSFLFAVFMYRYLYVFGYLAGKYGKDEEKKEKCPEKRGEM